MQEANRLVFIGCVVILAVFDGVVSGNCPEGCYEVRSAGGTTFESCDCCGTGKEKLFNPCENTTCPSTEHCVLIKGPYEPNKCTSDDYFPLEPQCRPECPMLKCAPYCVPTIGPSGCPSCYCDEKNPFENPCLQKDACGPEEECVLEEVTCVKEPCYPIKQCRPQRVNCPEGCLKYEESGEEKCHCCNKCLENPCKDGFCVLNTVQCFACPCPPLAACVTA